MTEGLLPFLKCIRIHLVFVLKNTLRHDHSKIEALITAFLFLSVAIVVFGHEDFWDSLLLFVPSLFDEEDGGCITEHDPMPFPWLNVRDDLVRCANTLADMGGL